MGSASCLGHLPFLSMVSKSTLQRDTFLHFLFLKRTVVFAVVSIGGKAEVLCCVCPWDSIGRGYDGQIDRDWITGYLLLGLDSYDS